MATHARARVPWSRLVGAALVAVAVWCALDSDWPVAPQSTAMTSASGGAGLLPRPISPRGPVDRGVREFVWEWDGPELGWRLVVLDADLRRVHEEDAGPGPSFTVRGRLDRVLRRRGEFQWFVEGILDGRRVHSAPVLFTVR